MILAAASRCRRVRNRTARGGWRLSGVMDSKHLRRLLFVAIFVGTGFVALGARLYVLQVVRHEKYRTIADNNTQRVFYREPRRGDILDANGNLLATSVP